VDLRKTWKDKFIVLAAKKKPEFEVHLRSFGVGKLYLIPLKAKDNHETFVKFRGIFCAK